MQGASVAWEEVSIGLCLRDVLFFFLPFSFRSPFLARSRDLRRTIKRDSESLDLIHLERSVRYTLLYCADNLQMEITLAIFAIRNIFRSKRLERYDKDLHVAVSYKASMEVIRVSAILLGLLARIHRKSRSDAIIEISVTSKSSSLPHSFSFALLPYFLVEETLYLFEEYSQGRIYLASIFSNVL